MDIWQFLSGHTDENGRLKSSLRIAWKISDLFPLLRMTSYLFSWADNVSYLEMLWCSMTFDINSYTTTIWHHQYYHNRSRRHYHNKARYVHHFIAKFLYANLFLFPIPFINLRFFTTERPIFRLLLNDANQVNFLLFGSLFAFRDSFVW